MTYDVVVVGGGAMGSAAAWQLAERGADVLMLEQFEAGHTKGASHGASRIFRVSYQYQEYIQLACEALELWRELEDLTATSLLTITGGVDHGAHPHLDDLFTALAAAGHPSTWLSVEEAKDRWPGFVFDTRVLFHPQSGRIHADAAVSALQEAARAAGADVQHRVPVNAVLPRGDDGVEVITESGVHSARVAVVAAGAWTRKLLGGAVSLPALRVTQEQPAHFLPVDEAVGWPSFGHLPGPDSVTAQRFFGGVYGLQTPGEGVKVGFHGVGPEVDPDHRDYQPNPQQLARLQEYVSRWLPGLDPVTVAPISCTYTTTPDAHFVLDRVGPIVVAAGFSGHGFKFTPAIGRVLADLATSSPAPHPFFQLGTRSGVST